MLIPPVRFTVVFLWSDACRERAWPANRPFIATTARGNPNRVFLRVDCAVRCSRPGAVPKKTTTKRTPCHTMCFYGSASSPLFRPLCSNNAQILYVEPSTPQLPCQTGPLHAPQKQQRSKPCVLTGKSLGGCSRLGAVAKNTYAHKYIHQYIHKHLHRYMHKRIQPYIHACMHTYMRACIHT